MSIHLRKSWRQSSMEDLVGVYFISFQSVCLFQCSIAVHTFLTQCYLPLLRMGQHSIGNRKTESFGYFFVTQVWPACTCRQTQPALSAVMFLSKTTQHLHAVTGGGKALYIWGKMLRLPSPWVSISHVIFSQAAKRERTPFWSYNFISTIMALFVLKLWGLGF